MNLENLEPQQPNNTNWVGFNKFMEDLANVVKTKVGVDIGNTNLYKNHMILILINFLSHVVGVCLIQLNLVVMMTEPHGNTLVNTLLTR
jgi:hypothetical protein